MLTAALLDQGTTTRSAAQIAEEIDFMGGLLGSGAGTDLSFVNTVSMKRRPGPGARPDGRRRAPPGVLRRRDRPPASQALSSLKVAADDPDTVASQVIDRLVFGFHPYGMPSSGTEPSLVALTRDDFVNFHKAWFVPNNALIAIVGAVPADEAFAQVQRVFGDWASGEVPAFAPMDPPPPVKRVVVIDKPGSVQTEIRAGHLAIPRKHPDHLVIDQVVKILGGEGGNRLQQVLRTQKSLTYGASADLDAYKLAGGVIAETDTRTEATTEALRTVVDEFFRLQRERVYDGELEGAQNFLAGSFPLSIESPDAIADAGAQSAVLRAAARGAAGLSRARAVGHARRRPAGGEARGSSRRSSRSCWSATPTSSSASSPARASPTVERIPIEELDLAAADLRRRASRRALARCRMSRVMLSCGEPSGDLYAAPLARALRRAPPRPRRLRLRRPAAARRPACGWSAATPACRSPG